MASEDWDLFRGERNKQHNLSAPGTSDVISATKFRAMCLRASSQVGLQLPVAHDSSDNSEVPFQQKGLSSESDEVLSQKMGLDTGITARIKDVCE